MNDSSLVNGRINDPGLQPQRTILSWFRTTAVIFVNALLLIKVGLKSNHNLLLVAGIIILLLATFIYAYTLRRNQKLVDGVDIVRAHSVWIHRLICGSLFLTTMLVLIHFFLNFFNLTSRYL